MVKAEPSIDSCLWVEGFVILAAGWERGARSYRHDSGSTASGEGAVAVLRRSRPSPPAPIGVKIRN
jgi:hypothetical protein